MNGVRLQVSFSVADGLIACFWIGCKLISIADVAESRHEK